MIAEIISITSGQLNTGIEVIGTITAESITRDPVTLTKYFRPTRIDVKNSTGVEVGFIPMTAEEYTAYLLGATSGISSDYIPVANGVTESLTSFTGNVTTLAVKGTTGHTAGLTFVVIKE